MLPGPASDNPCTNAHCLGERMHSSRSLGSGSVARLVADGGRRLALVLVLAILLVPISGMPQPVRTFPVVVEAVALGDTHTAPHPSVTATTAAALGDALSDVAAWRALVSKVRQVQAPSDIAADQPLTVEVHAIDADGYALTNAQVKVTWILPDGQYRDTRAGGSFGQADVTRTLGSTCRGKSCVVVVAVNGDQGWACACSEFKPR
jgi:hypothetical protein